MQQDLESGEGRHDPDLRALTDRLQAAIRDLRQAVSESKAARVESRALVRHANEVLRRSNSRRDRLFHGASDALAEFDDLTRDKDAGPGT